MANFRSSLTLQWSFGKELHEDWESASRHEQHTGPKTPSKTTPSSTAPCLMSREPPSPLRSNPTSPHWTLPLPSQVTLGPAVLRSNLIPKGGNRVGQAVVGPKPIDQRNLEERSCSSLWRPGTIPNPIPIDTSSVAAPSPPGTFTRPAPPLPSQTPRSLAFKLPQLRISLPLPLPAAAVSTSTTPGTPGSAFSPSSFYAMSPFSCAFSKFSDAYSAAAGAGVDDAEGHVCRDGGDHARTACETGVVEELPIAGAAEEMKSPAVGPLTARVKRLLEYSVLDVQPSNSGL